MTNTTQLLKLSNENIKIKTNSDYWFKNGTGLTKKKKHCSTEINEHMNFKWKC